MDNLMKAVISGDEGVEVEQPLLCWANSVEADEEVRKILKIMLRAYRLTNDCYDKRFDGKERIDSLTQYLSVVDDYSPSCNNDIVETMKDIVKANILLRRGQVEADYFIDPTDDYHLACVILEQLYEQRESKNADFLEFLIQLNLGKYFRNMGMYNHRSDFYWRAYDEFNNLLGKLLSTIDSKSEKNKEPWKDYIWLEAMMNLSRTEIYLYHLKAAKFHLWYVYKMTSQNISQKINSIFTLDVEYELNPDYKKFARIGAVLADSQDSNTEKTKSNLETRNGYAIQSLIQMGIAYRKTRDYTIAREIFAMILCKDIKVAAKDGMNVDALNNYAVCLRKSGFYIDYITSAEQKLINYFTSEESDKSEVFEEIKESQESNQLVKCDVPMENVKKLYLAIISCVLQGENTENQIKAMIRTKISASDKIDVETLKNRFAIIEFIRFALSDMNICSYSVDKIGEHIDERLASNPNDRELLLQKGLFFQRVGKLKDSNEIFRKLYSDYPQIARGTIGLKAVYNLGCNLLAEKRYHEAKKYFLQIKNAISSSEEAIENVSYDNAVVCLADLPNIDVLSEMDYAWCLMNIREYEDAKEIYVDILTHYGCFISRLGLHNEMKIRNNLIECCLQILACYYKTGIKSDRLLKIEKIIEENFRCIYNREPLNGTALRHEGYHNLLRGMYAEADEQNPKHLCDALNCFKKAAVQLHKDVYVHSGWVSAAYALWQTKKNHSSVIDQVKKRLHYISGPYSIRSCAKLAEILYSLDTRLGRNTEDKILLRCLARLQISDGEEGYSLFQELKANDCFSALNPVDRGKLLIILFQIYKNILDIKEHCRYYPDSNNLPVQYRSIKRLKNYLEGEKDQLGRFSLWNIAYMNDYFEGESFNKMLKEVADNDYEEIAEYYINSKEDDNGDDLISSAEKNIYISSLSLKKDVIPMWIAYADTGKGCAVTYSEEFLRLLHRRDLVTDVACYSDADYPLYKVCYIDSKTLGNSEHYGTLKEINCVIRTIIQLLRNLKSQLEDMVHTNGYGQKLEYVIIEFVRSCFNEVRFLIKDSEYASEEEIRMIHYSKEGKLSVEDDRIPRFYIEREGEVLIEEVILGPKIDTFQQNEISTWLYKTGKVKKVKRSNRHYR